MAHLTARFLVEVVKTDSIDTLCAQLQDEGTSCMHKYYRVFTGFAAKVRHSLCPVAGLPCYN